MTLQEKTSMGGKARAEKLSSERLVEIARMGANARWNKPNSSARRRKKEKQRRRQKIKDTYPELKPGEQVVLSRPECGLSKGVQTFDEKGKPRPITTLRGQFVFQRQIPRVRCTGKKTTPFNR